jgi:cobyrinic acid a,c-diamide synthase
MIRTPPPGLIIAAPASGSGKTTVTLGLMRALTRKGLVVQPFKCGPDYIDPAFHAVATGRASHNLDTWAMRHANLAQIVHGESEGASVVIAEGVMGLFDSGVDAAGQTSRGSTADLAALTGWPVVLVLDVSAQAETAAALALGCARFREDIAIAGVILNRVGGDAHARMIVPALEGVGIRYLGALPRRTDFALPERHLGLVQAGETADVEARIGHIADAIAERLDLDALVRLAQPAKLAPMEPSDASIRPPGQRIALAADAAFAFVYPHVLSGWRRAGAEIVPFSPLADEVPDAAADAVWLPGGYPELHAGALASARRFHQGLAAAASGGAAVHGECGGYMVLGAGLVDKEGYKHKMAGLLGVETSFARPAMHLGYRRVRVLADCAIGATGSQLMGHEFHFASVIATGDDPLLAATGADGQPVAECGARRTNVTGTFVHIVDRVGP